MLHRRVELEEIIIHLALGNREKLSLRFVTVIPVFSTRRFFFFSFTWTIEIATRSRALKTFSSPVLIFGRFAAVSGSCRLSTRLSRDPQQSTLQNSYPRLTRAERNKGGEDFQRQRQATSWPFYSFQLPATLHLSSGDDATPLVRARGVSLRAITPRLAKSLNLVQRTQ